MRIKINLTGVGTLPINNQHILNSYVHKCFGNNNVYHDSKNDYNISQIMGGKFIDGKLYYDNSAYFIVSSLNSELINNFLMGVLNNQQFNDDLTFGGVDHINERFHDGWNHFSTLSPILIKKYVDKHNYSFITIEDPEYTAKLKLYLINKLSKINSELDLSDFDIEVNTKAFSKIKTIMVKNVKNVASLCQISIHTNKNVAELLYNIGIGQSTGSGFGTIYKTENHRIYRKNYKI